MKTKKAICKICNKERDVNYYNKNPGNCRNCANKIKSLGSNNGFYGKKHTTETKSKIGKYARTEKQKQQAREQLSLVSNRRPFYDIWVEKYGKEEADKKLIEYKLKQSQLNSGENNSMYGKPAPMGSGNGWSGWYEGVFFRSILELSYLYFLLEKGIKFESGEKKLHSVEYEYVGKKRSYFPDYYLLETDEYVEVKPKKLINTELNKVKACAILSAGKRFNYITEDNIDILCSDIIDKLYDDNKLKWIDRYDKKYHEKYRKK